MKSNNKLKRNDFWKIECLDCGVNVDLLTDSWKRIICRECLSKHEFSEVENEIYAESDKEMESLSATYGHERRENEDENGYSLSFSSIGNRNEDHNGLQVLIDRNGEA